jgi:hypothetical protein
MSVKPIVNWNGDNAKTLMANYEAAQTAINRAQDALAKCAPHGRNYQNYSDWQESWSLATSEYRKHQEALQAAADYLGEEWNAVWEQDALKASGTK